uniref:exodeoxyribonuclease III n=1 Tax=Amphiprion ocellaris TaxID=80972 RepID=A0A3Q1BRK9_AMPOC
MRKLLKTSLSTASTGSDPEEETDTVLSLQKAKDGNVILYCYILSDRTSSLSMFKFNIVAWNVHGIRSQTKRVKIMDYVSKLKADILLLQETHLLQSEEKCLSDSNYSIIFSSCYNSRQRGVSILVHKRIPFTLNSTVTDSEGRYIIIQATIFNKLYSIVNLYAPNNEDPAFFHTVFSHLADLSANSTTIIGGDFNIVLNPSVDRSNSPIHVKQSQSVKVIHDYMKDFGLDDVWRLKNPTKRDYTFFSEVHKTFSRLDFFLLNNSIAHKVTTKIHPIIISDHTPISLSLAIKKNPS